MQQAIQGLGEKSKELEQEIQVLLQEIDESRKKKEETPAPTTKECPYCKEQIAIDATRCPHCTSELE